MSTKDNNKYLIVYKWQKTNYPWWQFWKPTHVEVEVGRIKLE
jgi:hypothetical protein